MEKQNDKAHKKSAKALKRAVKKDLAATQAKMLLRKAATGDQNRETPLAPYIAALVDPDNAGKNVGIPDQYSQPTAKYQLRQQFELSATNFAIPPENGDFGASCQVMLNPTSDHPCWVSIPREQDGDGLPVTLAYYAQGACGAELQSRVGSVDPSSAAVAPRGIINAVGSHFYPLASLAFGNNTGWAQGEHPAMAVSCPGVQGPCYYVNGDGGSGSDVVTIEGRLNTEGITVTIQIWIATSPDVAPASFSATALTVSSGYFRAEFTIGAVGFVSGFSLSSDGLSLLEWARAGLLIKSSAGQPGGGSGLFQAVDMPLFKSILTRGLEFRPVSASLTVTATSSVLNRGGRIVSKYVASGGSPGYPIDSVGINKLSSLDGAYDGDGALGTYVYWTPATVAEVSFASPGQNYGFANSFLTAAVVAPAEGQNYRALFVVNYELRTMDPTMPKSVTPADLRALTFALTVLSNVNHACDNPDHKQIIAKLLQGAKKLFASFVRKVAAPTLGAATGALFGPEMAPVGYAAGQALSAFV